MTPPLAWASLLLLSVRRDGFRNPWLWIAPLLVAQQVSDLDRRPWVLYVVPFIGFILGNALNGRGVTPSGARLSESPALPVPVSARARVTGALVAGLVVCGLLTLTAFAVAQLVRELIDLAMGGPDTFIPDPVRALRNTATCVGALLPMAILPAAAPPGRSVPWLEWTVLGLVGAGLFFDAPAILGNLSTLTALSGILCATVVVVAPLIERTALQWAARSQIRKHALNWRPYRGTLFSTLRHERQIGVLGAPPRSPAGALLILHLSSGLVTTLGLMLPLAALSTIVFFSGDRTQTLAFLLPRVLTLVAAATPTLPLGTGPAGAVGLDVRAAMWLPVRPQTLWWTTLLAAGAQLGVAFVLAIAGTAALTLAVPSVSTTEIVGRILASSPVCITSVLLLRAGLFLGPLIPVWARIGCLSVGAFAAAAAPVDMGVPRHVYGDERLAVALTLLVVTAAALVFLTPRSVRRA
jgi:hypothetical protein